MNSAANGWVVAFSTSSPWASVAILDLTGLVAYSAIEEAPRRASEACLRLLEAGLAETGLSLKQVGLFASDLGPGSFTGVRVGVVLAKTMAWAGGAQCVGADCFDLIDPDSTVAVPSKKNEWFIRIPGQPPTRTVEAPLAPVQGFGFPDGHEPPNARRFGPLLAQLTRVSAEAFAPEYLMEPSISTPKRAYREPHAG